jgi:hypothetical protein
LREFGNGTLSVLNRSDVIMRILYSRVSGLPARQPRQIDATRRISNWRAGVCEGVVTD